MRLLIVEDNQSLADLLISALTRSGFTVDHAVSAGAAAEMLALIHYAAMVLDLGLPDADGLTLLKALRAQLKEVPVLILTARAGLQDRLAGLHGGADDYLAKPFDYEELLARLRALLRRPGHILGRVLRLGDVALETESRELTVAGRPEAFSAQDLRLLELLMRRSGHVVTKAYVEGQLFGHDPEIGSNAVEVAIHRLRRRLEHAGAGVRIHTARGVGYLITEAAP